MKRPMLTLKMPEWLEEFEAGAKDAYPGTEERMRFVIELSRLNMEHGGGPFAAAVFNSADGTMLAAGVNLVLSANCSVLHAEVVALILAQQKTGSYDLGAEGKGPYELVTSTEPCAMCLGAVQWAGVRGLVCGARGEDAEHIGFDEGEKPGNWIQALERRGISVIRDVCREEAAAVLREYDGNGGVLYNPARKVSGPSHV